MSAAFYSIAWMSIAAISTLVLMLAALSWMNFNDTSKSGARIKDLKQKITALQEKRPPPRRLRTALKIAILTSRRTSGTMRLKRKDSPGHSC